MTPLERKAQDWLEAGVLGHGLWARYQEACVLIPELLHEVKLLQQLNRELIKDMKHIERLEEM